jgi:hypothetical protein
MKNPFTVKGLFEKSIDLSATFYFLQTESPDLFDLNGFINADKKELFTYLVKKDCAMIVGMFIARRGIL